jgi:K(+)-stimulated pyrophosphate-energized sodium pump
MREVSELIYETCKTYLATQGKFLMLLEALIAVIIILYFGVLQGFAAFNVIIILLFSVIGISGSFAVAAFGMRVNTFANSRTAFASLTGKAYPCYNIPLQAGISIGMSNLTVFWRIIFPQMFHVTLPPLGNTVIAVLNEGSLGFAIGYIDIIGKANLSNAKTLGTKTMEIYFGAAILYWICSIIIGQSVSLIEKHFGKYKAEY